MESRLVYLETLCCQCDEQTFKQQNINNLETYRKKKRYDLLFCEGPFYSFLYVFYYLSIMAKCNRNRAVSTKINTQVNINCPIHILY